MRLTVVMFQIAIVILDQVHSMGYALPIYTIRYFVRCFLVGFIIKIIIV